MRYDESRTTRQMFKLTIAGFLLMGMAGIIMTFNMIESRYDREQDYPGLESESSPAYHQVEFDVLRPDTSFDFAMSRPFVNHP